MINNNTSAHRIIAILVAILGGAWAFFIHSVNIRYLESIDSPKVENGMVLTSDDIGYIRPAENFINKRVWKDNTRGISSYIARTPGMGMIHLVFYKISPDHHQVFHRLFHLLLHVLGLYFFGLTCYLFLKQNWAHMVFLSVSFLPCFWGYIFYYLSESVTTSLMIFLFYSFAKYHFSSKGKWILIQSVIVGFLILVRPQLLFFVLPFIYFLIHYLIQASSNKLVIGLTAFILAFGGFISWEIRSVYIADRFTFFHGIYDETNSTQYRPVHQSFVELYKVYDWDNKRFHTMMLEAWEPDFQPTKEWLDKNVLLHGCVGLSKDKMGDFLKEYNDIAKIQRPVFESGSTIPAEQKEELALRLKLEHFTRELKRNNWFLCNIIGPIHSGQFMIVKSQLNLAIFQHKYRGVWWMETLRWLCLSIVLFSFIFSTLQIENFRNKVFFLFTLSTLVYFFYLCFVHKINEERYVVPLLPILFLMAAECMQRILNYLKSTFIRQ